jgi:S-adenosylmethionine synthetase
MIGDITARTAEHVTCGHPDKYCDQVADAILDEAMRLANSTEERRGYRTAIECLLKDRMLIISGEVNYPDSIKAKLDISKIARRVWMEVGYDHADELTVIEHLRRQSEDIAWGDGTGTDVGGAGDQGIMVGYATAETPNLMPLEYELARSLAHTLHQLRITDVIPWLKSDCKTQITLSAAKEVSSIVVAAQHNDGVSNAMIRSTLMEMAIEPTIKQYGLDMPSSGRVVINGTGRFVVGGSIGDAGVVGRKIVVDAYGPRVPVGGGAYSGKDPSKVDRSAAYMARYIAKKIVKEKIGGATECLVSLAYAIGQHEPEMIAATTDKGDLSELVREEFAGQLSPQNIQDRLKLWEPQEWRYQETGAYGHYGWNKYPWEQV